MKTGNIGLGLFLIVMAIGATMKSVTAQVVAAPAVDVQGPPPEQPSGGRMEQRVIAKKKAEMQDHMEDVKGVLSMYVPSDPQRMQQAFQGVRCH